MGVSAGIKGVRFGTGPRGNYVHMSAGGLCYRRSLPSGTIAGNRTEDGRDCGNGNPEFDHEPLKEIESAHVSEMVDSSSADLVAEMNANRKKYRIWPFIAAIGSILTIITIKHSEAPLVAVSVCIGSIVLTALASVKDSLRKTTVLFYELEPEIESLYQKLHDSFGVLSLSAKKWHVQAEGAVRDGKRNAGATSVVERNPIIIKTTCPPNVKTNVVVPSIPVGKQTLYFFPDKVLIFEPNGVGAVSYPNLRIHVESTRFVEDGGVPRDAKIVDTTWKYVNKRGGPDKRFKDNRELPVALYEDLHFKSDTGLNERVEVSKVGHGIAFSNAISRLAENL